MKSINPMMLPTLRVRFEKLPDEQKKVVAWIYDFARGDKAVILIGIMSGFAMDRPEATWWEIAEQAKEHIIKLGLK